MRRISKKQVYRAWYNRRDVLKGLSIWEGFNYWSLYQGALNGVWLNERIFKSNRVLYDFLLFGE